MLDPVILPVQTQSQSLSTNSKHLAAARSRTTKNADLGLFDPGKLSSTLDKLYVWEKKLHKIVQVNLYRIVSSIHQRFFLSYLLVDF